MSRGAVERFEEVVGRGERRVAGRDQQVAALRGRRSRPGSRRGRRGRAGRRGPGGRPRRAVLRAARGWASATPRRGRALDSPRASASTRAWRAGVGRDGEDQAALAADGVEPEQAAVGVDERAARGAARERRGVLDRARDAAPARAAERAAGGGDEPERRAQAVAAGVGEREHRRADREARRRRRAPTSTAGASPVSTSTTPTSRSASAPATRPVAVRPSSNVTVTSSPRSACAAVRTRFGATITPEPRAQPRPRPTTDGPTRSAAPATACVDFVEKSHLQIASYHVGSAGERQH